MRRIIQFTALLAVLQFGVSAIQSADGVGSAEYDSSPFPASDPFDAPSVIKVISTSNSNAESAADRSERSSSLDEAPQADRRAWKTAPAPRTIDMRISDVPVEEGPTAAPPAPIVPVVRPRAAATITPVAPRAEQPLDDFPVDAPLPPAVNGTAKPEATKPSLKKAVAAPSQKPLLVEDDEELAKTEIVRERYPNSMVKIERHVKQDANGDFVNHGSWIKFDEKGRMIGGGEYKSGKREGKWTHWFAANEGPLFSGPLFKDFAAPFTSEATYENDQLSGVWRVVDDKNRKVCEWNFENGVQHGKSEWYWVSGQVRRHIEFEQGAVHGDVLEYAADGKIAKKDAFIHGRRLALQTDWFEPNVKRAEGWTLLAREVVKPNFNFWEGIATFTVVATEGQNQRHGVWTWWHKNGQKQMEGRFEFDQPTGQFAWWHVNGQKQLEGVYVDGKQDGKFVWWHANGMKMMEGDYLAGVQIDAWMRWNETGKVVETARYSADGEQLDFKQFGTKIAAGSEDVKSITKPMETAKSEAFKPATLNNTPRPFVAQPLRRATPVQR